MIDIWYLVFFGGILHFATLIGSAQVPKEMDFKNELPKLNPLLQHWIWTAGGYIVLNILTFGVLATCLTSELISGSVLARAICAYISIFWGIRLLIQLFLFDAKPYLRNLFLKIGYHGLTLVFAYHTFLFGYLAIGLGD